MKFPTNYLFAYIFPTFLCLFLCYWTEEVPEFIPPRQVITVGNAGVHIFPETEIHFMDRSVDLIYSTTLEILNTDNSDRNDKKPAAKSKKINKSDFNMDKCKTGVLTPSAVPKAALIKVLTELEAAMSEKGSKLSVPVSQLHLYYNRNIISKCFVDEHTKVLKFTISIPMVSNNYSFKKVTITHFPNPKDDSNNRYFSVNFQNDSQYTHVLVNQGKEGPDYLPFTADCRGGVLSTLCPAPKPEDLKPDPCITAILTNEFLHVVHQACVLKAGEPAKELISTYVHHKFYITNPSDILRIECLDKISKKRVFGIIPSLRRTTVLGIPCSCQLNHGLTLIERPNCPKSKKETADVEYFQVLPTHFLKVRPELAKIVRWSEIKKHHNLYDSTRKEYVQYQDTIGKVPVTVKVPDPIEVKVPASTTPDAPRQRKPHMSETHPYLWHFSVVYVFAMSVYRLYLAQVNEHAGAAFNLTPYFWRD